MEGYRSSAYLVLLFWLKLSEVELSNLLNFVYFCELSDLVELGKWLFSKTYEKCGQVDEN